MPPTELPASSSEPLALREAAADGRHGPLEQEAQGRRRPEPGERRGLAAVGEGGRRGQGRGAGRLRQSRPREHRRGGEGTERGDGPHGPSVAPRGEGARRARPRLRRCIPPPGVPHSRVAHALARSPDRSRGPGGSRVRRRLRRVALRGARRRRRPSPDAPVPDGGSLDGALPEGAVSDGGVRFTGPMTLVSNESAPRGLAVDETRLFWVDAEGAGNAPGSARSAPKGGGAVTTIGPSQTSPARHRRRRDRRLLVRSGRVWPRRTRPSASR